MHFKSGFTIGILLLFGVVVGNNNTSYVDSSENDTPLEELTNVLGNAFVELLGFGNTENSGGLVVQLHGHYCGPGHGDPTYRQKPVDQLDAVCMRHDKCYDKTGYLDCGCDYEYLKGLDQFIRENQTNKELRNTAWIMKTWFESSGCICTKPNEEPVELKGRVKRDMKKQCTKNYKTSKK